MLELEHGFRAVDVDTRPDLDEWPVAVRGREISPERLECELHRAGIVRTVVLSGAQRVAGNYLRPNNAVVRMSVGRPFLAFAHINGPRDPGGRASARLRNFRSSRAGCHADPDDIEQCAYDDRFHGFSLAPAVDGLPDDETLAMSEDVGLPVSVEDGQAFEPSAVAQSLFGRFPVILSGFGGFPLDRGLMDETIGLLDDHEDLYLDMGFVRYQSVFEYALLEHSDWVLFGSNAPETHPNVSAMEALTLDVSEDALAKVFSKNAAWVIAVFGPGEQ